MNCIHHYVIEPPHPGLLTGVCKHCGDVRQWPAAPGEDVSRFKKFTTASLPTELFVADVRVRKRVI